MSHRHIKKIKKSLSTGFLDIMIPAAGLGKRMKSHGPKSLIPIKYGQRILDRQVSLMGDGEVGCIINKKGYLENLMYDLPVKWCQIAYFQGKELEELRNIACQRKNKKLFAFEIINKIIDEGGMFKCIDDPSVKVIDVDTSKDIKRAKEII